MSLAVFLIAFLLGVTLMLLGAYLRSAWMVVAGLVFVLSSPSVATLLP